MKTQRGVLTAKQASLLGFIRRFTKKNHYPPTTTEICEEFDYWPNGAHQHLRAIERKGYIRRVPNTARGLVIL